MSLKLKLAVFTSLSLAALALIMFTRSTPQRSIAKSPDIGQIIEGTGGKQRLYPNNVIKIEPDNFAVTTALKDFPDATTYGPDEFRNPEKVLEERRMEILQIERKDKGLPPLTDIQKEEVELNWRNAERVKKVVPGAGAGLGEFIDPAIFSNDRLAPQAMPTPSITFDGATAADNSSAGAGTGFTPPDVNGDVGPNHYVSSINLVLKIFNKNGTVAMAAKKTSALFESLPAGDPCRSRNDGDPVVVYDSLADRWVITQFSIPGNSNTSLPNYECIAVSTTPDPTGTYFVWSYQYPGTLFNDYPKIGVWRDAYHITFNQFTNGGTWRGLGILSQDRVAALSGDAGAVALYINYYPVDPNAGGALPADIDGIVPPPAGMPQIFAEFRADEFGDPADALRIYKWTTDFVNPANSVFSALPDVALAAFDARSPSSAPIEVQGGASLDGLNDRLMHRFAYRNLGSYSSPVNSYTGNFTVNVSGINPASAATYQAGIRWFELRRSSDSFTVRDQGTHTTGAIDAANGLNNWMGSIAQDNQGSIALGFSQAGTGQNADIRIAGRTGSSTGAGLTEGESLMYDAPNAQSTGNRWGDYSAMSVDPSDDCTFWYTQEYYATSSSSGFSTRVGSFKYPGCTPAPKATISGTITSCSTGQPISAAAVVGTGGYHRLTPSNGTYSMVVSPGSYSISASKSLGYVSDTQSATVTSGGTATVNICLQGVAVLSATTPTLSSESCGTPNNSPDPGEQITAALPISNIGGAGTSNLVATLRATGGVQAAVTQNYGAIAAAGGTASRNFTFRVNSSHTCGSPVTLTWDLSDGSTSFGSISQNFATGTPILNLSQNFDGVSAPALPSNWTQSQLSGTGITWTTVTSVPVSSSPNVAFANGPGAVNSAALESPAVAISTSNATMTFKKSFSLESGTTTAYDAAVLEIKIGTGNWQDIVTAGGGFVSGGYNMTVSSSYNNPLGGRQAWSGSSTTFTTTQLTLPSSANGQSVRFRWIVATDDSTTSTGFRLDDVQVSGGVQCYSCFQIGGAVKVGTNGLSGVSVALTGGGSSTVSTASDGTYSFASVLSGNNYTITPSRSGYYFTPASRSYTGLAADYSTQDFAASACTYSLGATSVSATASGGTGTLTVTPGNSACSWTASSNNTWITVTSGSSGTGNGTVGYSVAANTGSSRSGTITAGGQTFTVNQAAASAPNRRQMDFDGDGKTDYSIFRPSGTAGAEWWYLKSGTPGGYGSFGFGASTDIPTPADFTGDGKTDLAFYRPGNGYWYVLKSEDFTYYAFPFGASTDIPTPGDFDGDGKADAAVYRPSTGAWYIYRSSDGQVAFGSLGNQNDKPAVSDYDGDGKADIGIFRAAGTAGAEWWYLKSGTPGAYGAIGFGISTDKPALADFTGDGKADIAVYRPGNGYWYVLKSEDFTYYAFPFGASTDIPTPGDFDGDGKADAVVYRPSTGTWYVFRSTNSAVDAASIGISTDRPLPGILVR